MRELNRAVLVALIAFLVLVLEVPASWQTPDQSGDRLMRQEQYSQAANQYEDPMRVGIAWFRAGDFEQARQAFAGLGGAEASYNLGNSLVMLGQYSPAVEAYLDALAFKPDWQDARTNLAIARERAAMLDSQGGDMGDQKIGADEVKFDQDGPDAGQETQVESEQANQDAAMQSLWLNRVQTSPADFLKAKFAYQLNRQEAQ